MESIDPRIDCAHACCHPPLEQVTSITDLIMAHLHQAGSPRRCRAAVGSACGSPPAAAAPCRPGRLRREAGAAHAHWLPAWRSRARAQAPAGKEGPVVVTLLPLPSQPSTVKGGLAQLDTPISGDRERCAAVAVVRLRCTQQRPAAARTAELPSCAAARAASRPPRNSPTLPTPALQKTSLAASRPPTLRARWLERA